MELLLSSAIVHAVGHHARASVEALLGAPDPRVWPRPPRPPSLMTSAPSPETTAPAPPPPGADEEPLHRRRLLPARGQWGRGASLVSM